LIFTEYITTKKYIMFNSDSTNEFQERPVDLIHYFTKDGEYIESVMITELHEKRTATSSDGKRQRIIWSKTGEKRKRLDPFDINHLPPSKDPTYIMFYAAVVDCFNKREARVITTKIYPEYNFTVQYLVKQETKN